MGKELSLNILEIAKKVQKLEEGGSYADLSSKPQVNGVELSGNKTTSDLGINADNVMMSDGTTSVEDNINKLITARLTYSGADGYFQIPQGTPGPYASQVTVVARNIANGAIYALWYDATVVCFQVGAIISGDAPSNGNIVYVQYSAIPMVI